MKRNLLTCLLAFVVFAAIAQPQQIQRPDGKTLSPVAVDSIVKKLMDTAQVTGLELGIISSNNISYVKSYGFKQGKRHT